MCMGMPGEVKVGTPPSAPLGTSSQAALGGSRDQAGAGTGPTQEGALASPRQARWGEVGQPLPLPPWMPLPKSSMHLGSSEDPTPPPALYSEGVAFRVSSALAPAALDMLCDPGLAAQHLCT